MNSCCKVDQPVITLSSREYLTGRVRLGMLQVPLDLVEAVGVYHSGGKGGGVLCGTYLQSLRRWDYTLPDL